MMKQGTVCQGQKGLAWAGVSECVAAELEF